MLRRFLPLIALLTIAQIAAAQTNPKVPKDDFEIGDIPEEEAHPYFALGGGFTMQWLSPKFDAMNAMTKTLGIPAFDKSMMITGGAGLISSPFGKNLRIGGAGYGGATIQCVDVVDTIDNVPIRERRTAEFGVGGGGLTLEYVYPFKFSSNKLVLTGGLMLGLGSMVFQLDQTTSDPRTWSNFFDGSPTPNFTRQIHASYFSYQPYINLEYSLFAFLMLRASIGYNGTVIGTWTVDREIAISGVPDINGNGLVYGGGVFLGIFR